MGIRPGPIQGSRAEYRTKWREPWKLCKLPAALPTGEQSQWGESQSMPYDTDPGDGPPPAETGPSPRQQPPSHQRPSGMDRFLNSLSTTQKLLAGLTAVVVAAGTLWAAIAGLTDRTNAGVPTPTTQQPPSSTTGGPSTSGTTETTATPPSTTSMTLAGEVFRETDGAPVVVASCIDLDSQEPDWGVGSRSHKDLCVSFGSNGAARINATRLAVVDDPPKLEDCGKQIVLRPSTTTAETVPRQHLCVRSSDKRWAHVRIAAIDRSASTMSFDIVVWKLPSDP